ncbi:E3 ubiquitin-protein ligase TRIM33-like, partial [Mercenaria mercenaria]|uniref:E3 ubiquitin-protein ligase TRIM33-like n=1 Tax=Mercenaria mercenaria TaxID=6596 RepID=UPI00234E89EC
MAEGGVFTSIRDGSDADFEIVCAPCGEDNIREEAVKFCVECNQYLCTACARYHRRIAALKSHKLLDTDDVKNTAVAAIVTKCRYHPDRDIEMYCGTHDMVYCLKCIATEH